MVKSEQLVEVFVSSKIGKEGKTSQYRGKVTKDGFGALNPGQLLEFEGPTNLAPGQGCVIKKSGTSYKHVKNI